MIDFLPENPVSLAYMEFAKELVPFSKHPFRLYTGTRLDDMVRSIKEWYSIFFKIVNI